MLLWSLVDRCMSRERSGSRMHPFIDQFQVLRDVSLVDVSTHSTHYVRIMQYVILAVVSRGTLHSNPDDSATPPATPICTTRVQIRTCTSRTPPEPHTQKPILKLETQRKHHSIRPPHKATQHAQSRPHTQQIRP